IFLFCLKAISAGGLAYLIIMIPVAIVDGVTGS
ncbi:hypothetical protein LCGC14_2484630, partial [marine sediment metagenome]